MTRNKLKQIIREIMEVDDKEKIEKDKEDINQQKIDLDKKKLDFKKQQSDAGKRASIERQDDIQDKEDKEGEDESEQETEPNISFKTQGDYYKNALPELQNLTLTDGNLLDEDEKHFVALVIQAAQGRFDKEFINFLKKGHAGNVYGKDLSREDLQRIVTFVKEHELVR